MDSSVNGMGRGAGNLPTELITQYINKNIASRYDVTMVMDIYDEYISAIRKKFEWGYTCAVSYCSQQCLPPQLRCLSYQQANAHHEGYREDYSVHSRRIQNFV